MSNWTPEKHAVAKHIVKVLQSAKGNIGHADALFEEMLAEIERLQNQLEQADQFIIMKRSEEEYYAKEREQLLSALEELQNPWLPITEAEKDGRILSAAYSVKWTKYKPDGQRQMGVKGRWQYSNGYGGWVNCEDDPEFYLPNPPAAEKGE